MGEKIFFLKKEIFSYKRNVFKTREEESEGQRIKKIIKYIENELKSINYDLFKKHFNFVVPSALIKQSYEIKNKNNELLNVIKSGLSDLKDEIKKMSEDEKEIEKADKILKIVEEILVFNNKQNQIGKGLKNFNAKPNAK